MEVIFMQTKTRYEKIIIEEVREFPQSELPQIIKILHSMKSKILLHEKRKLRKPHRYTIESIMGSFKGFLSSSEQFSIKKNEEKILEL
jgi:hypothetical protein